MMWNPYTVTTPTARIKHRCDDCFGDINPGDKYNYTSGFYDGEPDTHKACLICRPDEDLIRHRPKEIGQRMYGYREGYPGDWPSIEQPLVVWLSEDGETWTEEREIPPYNPWEKLKKS